jgi:hypothetical protein
MATKKIYTRIGGQVFVTEIEVADPVPAEEPKRRGRKPKTEEPSMVVAPSEPTDETP